MADTTEQDVVSDSTTTAAPTQETESKPRGRRAKAQDDHSAADIADFTQSPAEEPESPAPQVDDAGEVSDPFLKRLSDDFGFSDLKDRADGEERLIAFAAEQKRERDEYEQWRRQNEPLVGYGRQYLESRQPEPKPQEQPKPWQPPVSYPDQATRYLTRNEQTGAVEWKPDVPGPVRAQAEQFIAWREGIVDMLTSRPDRFVSEFLLPLIDDRAKTVVEPFYEQRTAQSAEQQFLESYSQQHATTIFRVDPRSNQPVPGVLSDRGDLLWQRYQYLRERGLQPQEAMQYAESDVDRQVGPIASPTKTTVAATAEQRRREHVDRARNGKVPNAVRNRTGSYPQQGERRPQNDNGGFGSDFLEELERLTPSAS